jgi:anti-sigma-K factor RskA
MSRREHDDIQELLGAYVLHEVDPVEYRRVTKHLATCDECAREVSLLQGPAAELAFLEPSSDDAEALVERISTSLPWRGRRVVSRLSMAVAAVAVLVAGFLGVALRNENVREDRIAQVIAAAEESVSFEAGSGFEGGGRLYVAEGKAVLALDGVPAPGNDRAYQLWALASGKPRSMAVVEGSGRIVHLFDWDAPADAYAVTIEPAGGSPVPTSDPVLVST